MENTIVYLSPQPFLGDSAIPLVAIHWRTKSLLPCNYSKYTMKRFSSWRTLIFSFSWRRTELRATFQFHLWFHDNLATQGLMQAALVGAFTVFTRPRALFIFALPPPSSHYSKTSFLHAPSTRDTTHLGQRPISHLNAFNLSTQLMNAKHASCWTRVGCWMRLTAGWRSMTWLALRKVGCVQCDWMEWSSWT